MVLSQSNLFLTALEEFQDLLQHIPTCAPNPVVKLKESTGGTSFHSSGHSSAAGGGREIPSTVGGGKCKTSFAVQKAPISAIPIGSEFRDLDLDKTTIETFLRNSITLTPEGSPTIPNLSISDPSEWAKIGEQIQDRTGKPLDSTIETVPDHNTLPVPPINYSIQSNQKIVFSPDAAEAPAGHPGSGDPAPGQSPHKFRNISSMEVDMTWKKKPEEGQQAREQNYTGTFSIPGDALSFEFDNPT